MLVLICAKRQGEARAGNLEFIKRKEPLTELIREKLLLYDYIVVVGE